jgi:uncharacterized protein (TIGR02172 family)
MEKGELLGKGMTAEVYKWGQDKVLKLFSGDYKEEWIRREAEIGRRIYEAGVPSPAVFEMVDIDGRKGIIFERIPGRTVVGSLMAEPWKYMSFIRKMAHFQYEIHKRSAEGLPTQKERFRSTIMRSSELLGDRMDRILDYLDSLPVGSSICHGDFYLSNIMLTDKGMVAIDWSSGHIGDPSGDVARTCIIINSPAVPPGVPGFFSGMASFPRYMTYQAYLNEYIRVSKARTEDIDAWLLPVAAAKLRDNFPGEKKWLLGIIDERLARLGG